jgi:hypothetical protein
MMTTCSKMDGGGGYKKNTHEMKAQWLRCVVVPFHKSKPNGILIDLKCVTSWTCVIAAVSLVEFVVNMD